MRSLFEIPRSAKLFVFSEADLASVRLLNIGMEVEVHCNKKFEWYCEQDRSEASLPTTVSYQASILTGFGPHEPMPT